MGNKQMGAQPMPRDFREQRQIRIPTFATVCEVAAALQVHEETVLRLIRRKELHATLIGRHYRISPHALRTFLERCQTFDLPGAFSFTTQPRQTAREDN